MAERKQVDEGPTSYPDFGVVRGESPLYAAAVLDVADRALQFILGGVDPCGRSISKTDALQARLKASLVDGLTGGGIRMDVSWVRRVTAGRTPDDFARIAWGSYVRSHLKFAERVRLSKAMLPFVQAPDAEIALKMVVEAGGCATYQVPEGATGLQKAWHMARRNLERAEFRLASMYTLNSVISSGVKDEDSTSNAQAMALLEALWAAGQRAVTRVFATGVLVGEFDELKRLAKDGYNSKVSIAELLYTDALVPSVRTVDEEFLLRDEICSA